MFYCFNREQTKLLIVGSAALCVKLSRKILLKLYVFARTGATSLRNIDTYGMTPFGFFGFLVPKYSACNTNYCTRV